VAPLRAEKATPSPRPLTPPVRKLSGIVGFELDSLEFVRRERGLVIYLVPTLAVAQGLPDLSGLDDATRQSIELTCITQKSDGPVAYGECLRAQLHSIGIQPRSAAGSPPTRRPRGGMRGDGTRVRASPPVSPASNSTLPAASTHPFQATTHVWSGRSHGGQVWLVHGYAVVLLAWAHCISDCHAGAAAHARVAARARA
jgi:hypothetical protein